MYLSTKIVYVTEIMAKPRNGSGTRIAPLISKPIKASDIDAIRKRTENFAGELDQSWLVPGALGTVSCNLFHADESQKSPDKSISVLSQTVWSNSEKVLVKGAPVLYIGQVFMNITTARGPAKTTRHLWVDPTGAKRIIPIKCVNKCAEV